MITQYLLDQLKKITFQWCQINAVLGYSGKWPTEPFQQNFIDLDFFFCFLLYVFQLQNSEIL